VHLDTFCKIHLDTLLGMSVVWFTSNGQRRCCLTRPRTDFFLLRPFNATIADWEDLDRNVAIFDSFDLEGSRVNDVGHVCY